MPLGAARLGLLANQIVSASGVSLTGVSFTSSADNLDSGQFDGSSVGVDNPTHTTSYWFKAKATSPRIRSFNVTTGGRLASAGFVYQDTSAKYRHYQQTTGHTYDLTSAESGLYNPDEWHHVVIAADFSTANSVQCYLDGVELTMVNNTAFTTLQSWAQTIQVTMNVSDSSSLYDIAQVWVDNSYIDLSQNIDKFYLNGPVDMGADGTASGLSQPLIYHNGDLNTFVQNGGRYNYTMSIAGYPKTVPGPDNTTVEYSDAVSAYDMTDATGTQASWRWRALAYNNLGPHHIDNTTAVTFSAWFNHPDYDLESYEPLFAPFSEETDEVVLTPTAIRLRLDPRYRIEIAYDTDSPNGKAGGAPIRNNTWHHIVFSYQLSTSGSVFHCFIDGVDAMANYTLDFNQLSDIETIDTVFDTAVASRPGSTDFQGKLSQVWVNDEYTDLTVLANRQKFYNNGPVDFGSEGLNPTGNAPKIFLDGFNIVNKGTLGNDLTYGTITLADGPNT